MGTAGHIEMEILLEFAQGRVDAVTAARVRDHLDAGCAHCATELAFWHRVLVAGFAAAVFAPPEAWTERAIATFARRAGAMARPSALQPSLWERLAATLAFDSRAQPALAGVRDGTTAFQMLFMAGDTEIDLLCEPGESGWRVTGQALSPDTAATTWEVRSQGPDGETLADTGADGEFHFEELTPGMYDVTLRSPAREIVLKAIALGVRGPGDA